MNKVRGYIFSRSFMGERVPQHIQNLVIRDYCERNQLQYLLSATEYAMHDCHLIFESLLNELSQVSGIAIYSIFQLPESALHRQAIYKKFLKNQKVLHFSVEGLSARNLLEFDAIETLWRIRLTLPQCAIGARDMKLANYLGFLN